MAYRAYVTDALRIIATNTGNSAAVLGAHGAEIKARYMELIKRKQETRTAEEIISHISEGLRKVGEA